MFHLKKMIFSVLFHFYQFFTLSYPLWLMISSIGVSIGIILLLSGGHHLEQGITAISSFSLICLYLIALKHFYSKLLNWSDTRTSEDIIVPLR
ncbi:hypothetical protein [Photobacterium leiognathi]|uniref:hypothetical protein n=1 Tax=Photobacterium leiognathi TaxID=553611 RepID=UPI0027330EAD|nr:hypothetical protein [Photobacterium leiognathi]